jgi:DNA (cytosine-5)-methyltransferase 1
LRTHVDLFSGIGGFALACQWAGVETIAFAEIDPYASRVIERHFPGVRNYGDVRNVPSHSAWLLTAGIPCQPASVAGKRRGAKDDRWLWPETLAVVENGDYEWVLFENPTGILSLNDGVEFERICASLESKGYEVQPLVIPACAVNALHRRERVFIVAHAENLSRQRCSRRQGGHTSLGGEGVCKVLANTNDEGLQRRPLHAECSDKRLTGTRSLGNSAGEGLPNWAGGTLGQPSPITEFERPSGREIERNFRGVAHGVSRRVDRLRCLGNAIVPKVAYQLIKRMIEAEEVA